MSTAVNLSEISIGRRADQSLCCWSSAGNGGSTSARARPTCWKPWGGEDQQSLYGPRARPSLAGLDFAGGGLLARIIGRLTRSLEPSGLIGVPPVRDRQGDRRSGKANHVEAVLRPCQQQVDPCGGGALGFPGGGPCSARNLQECLRFALEAQGPNSGDDMQAGRWMHLGACSKSTGNLRARPRGRDRLLTPRAPCGRWPCAVLIPEHRRHVRQHATRAWRGRRDATVVRARRGGKSCSIPQAGR